MCRLQSTTTEITRCLDETNAEVPLPDTVHHHACGERVLRTCDPFGKRLATLLLGPSVRVALRAYLFLRLRLGKQRVWVELAALRATPKRTERS